MLVQMEILQRFVQKLKKVQISIIKTEMEELD